MTKLPFFADEPKFEVEPLNKDSFITRLQEFTRTPEFIRWAVITSLFIAVGSLASVWIAVYQIKHLQKVVDVHDQVLAKMAKGELPLLQKEDGTFVSAMAYIITAIKQQQLELNELNKATPTPVPGKFQIK